MVKRSKGNPRIRSDVPVPKYFVLRNLLRERFREYKRGDRLPSEPALAREFKVSRMTLQRALAGLEREGLIARRQGKGTFFIGERRRGSESLSGALESLMTYEGGSRAEVVEKTNWSEPPWDIRGRLELRPGEPVVVLKRVALVGDEPLFYIINYLPYDLGIKLYSDDRDLERFPIISLLREKYGVPLSRAVQTIEATLADTETAARLRIPVGAPVLLAERTYFARGGRAVQVSRAWYRADRYKYTVTLRHWRGSRRFQHRRSHR